MPIPAAKESAGPISSGRWGGARAKRDDRDLERERDRERDRDRDHEREPDRARDRNRDPENNPGGLSTEGRRENLFDRTVRKMKKYKTFCEWALVAIVVVCSIVATIVYITYNDWFKKGQGEKK